MPSGTMLDCWGSQVQPAEPVRHGVFAPKDGRFLLRAEVTGAKTGSSYSLGARSR